jgi:hypothetical protein
MGYVHNPTDISEISVVHTTRDVDRINPIFWVVSYDMSDSDCVKRPLMSHDIETSAANLTT